MLLVVASSASDSDWAERTALALATGWAGKKRRILLADLALTRPGLHQVVGVQNAEGMTDAFLFGSSVLKVAVPVRDKGFLFVPAGTATARSEAVAASPRWAAVVDACDRIRATLVVFLPSDLPGGEHLLERATDVFLLTDTGSRTSAALQAGLGHRLRGVLTPPPPVGAGDGEAPVAELAFMGMDTVPVEEPAAALKDDYMMPGPGAEVLAGLDLDLAFEAPPEEEAPSSETMPHAGVATPEPPPHAQTALPEWARTPVDSSVPETPSERSTPPRATVRTPPPAEPKPSASRSGPLALFAGLAVLAVLAAARFGVIEIPGITPATAVPDAAPAAPPAATTTASAPVPASPESPPLRVSLALGAFENAGAARLQANSLSEQRPDLLFVVAPVESAGKIYYRLLAGPAEDSASAVALREKLATTLTREDPSTWLVRATPLAFELGDRAELAEAKARVADLASVDIPAYVLELSPRTATGAIRLRYRVYGGAFADAEEASYFQSLLVSKGFPDARLTERTGRHPE